MAHELFEGGPRAIALYETSEYYFMRAEYNGNPKISPTLLISRPDGNIRVNGTISSHPIHSQRCLEEMPKLLQGAKPITTIYGILGMIQLLSGPYIIAVTEREAVGKLLGRTIYRIRKSELFACQQSLDCLSSQQMADEINYTRMLKSFLASEWLYYSDEYDLSRSLQKQTNDSGLLSVDTDYLVNRFIAAPLLKVLQTRSDTYIEQFLIFAIEGCMDICHSFHSRCGDSECESVWGTVDLGNPFPTWNGASWYLMHWSS